MYRLGADGLRHALVQLIVLVLSVCVHEFGHAYVADRLGDRLPRSQGRVTLNPFAHADPIGTIALPLFGALFGGMAIGWGKPVMVNPLAFTRKLRMKTGHMLVAAAGPAMNVLFAVAISLALFALTRSGLLRQPELASVMVDAVALNFLLACFNLLPFPPLDGGTVLQGLLPREAAGVIETIRPFGLFLLIAVVMSPAATVYRTPAVWLTTRWMGLLFGS